jgi:mRNA interferase MazF
MMQGQKSFHRYGDVWITELDHDVGSEIGKRRPGLVVSNDQNNRYSDTVTILPMTSQRRRRRYLHEAIVPAGVGEMSWQSRIKAYMIRTVDKSRLVRRVGTLPSDYPPSVRRAVAIHLNLSS